MFSACLVRIHDGRKTRSVIGTFEFEDEARRAADSAAIGSMTYTFVKGTSEATVFYLPATALSYVFHGPKENIRSLSWEALHGIDVPSDDDARSGCQPS